MITASDFSDLFQAFIRFIMVVAALIHVYRSGYGGRRKSDTEPLRWNWKYIDAVTLAFALLQTYGIVFLILRVFDFPLAQVDALKNFILPTTIVSNLLLAIHFLNGQVNKFIDKTIKAVQCRLTRI